MHDGQEVEWNPLRVQPVFEREILASETQAISEKLQWPMFEQELTQFLRAGSEGDVDWINKKWLGGHYIGGNKHDSL